MRLILKNEESYGRTITRLSILAVLSVFGCTLLGYFMLPFASAFYAGILIYEKPSKRVVSYVLPAVMFTVNLLLRGLYSLEAVAYIAVALIIYFSTCRCSSKAETSFWISLVVAVMIIASAIFLAFEKTGSFEILSIKQFYSNLYSNYRDFFVKTVTSLKVTDKNGMMFFAYNVYEAELLFRELIITLVPMLLVLSFVISGFTLKILSSIVERYSGEDSGIYEWSFKTPNLVAYFYLILSLIQIFGSDDDGSIFYFTVMSLSTLFSVVYAYIGVKFVYYFILSRGKSRLFAIILILILFIILSSFVTQIISYLGVIVNIITNKISSKPKNQ